MAVMQPTRSRKRHMQLVVDNLPPHRFGKPDGLAGLAHHLGVTRQTVSAWQRIPEDYVLRTEAYTGVPRELLRPDLYGTPPKGPLHKGLVNEARKVTDNKWAKAHTA